jgi:hypothetical protein
LQADFLHRREATLAILLPLLTTIRVWKLKVNWHSFLFSLVVKSHYVFMFSFKRNWCCNWYWSWTVLYMFSSPAQFIVHAGFVVKFPILAACERDVSWWRVVLNFFVQVPPDVISLHLCTAIVVGV